MVRASVNDFVLTDYAKSLIKFKARQICQRRDFQSAQPEDLQQDLWLALVKAAQHFDPSKASLNTFIDRVVNTAVAMLLRSRQCLKCREDRRTHSLDSAAPHSESRDPLAPTVSTDDQARRVGAVPRDPISQNQDCEAVDHALSQMPEEMRAACRKLMGGTVTSVARETGQSRRQVRKTIAAARPFFERAGFGND